MSTTLINQSRSGNLNIVVYQYEIPSLRELLTQGALAGVLVYFILTVVWSFSIINYYKMLVVGALPQFLGMGLIVGLIDGLATYCYTKLFTTRLTWIRRLAIAIAAVVMTTVAVTTIYGSRWNREYVFWCAVFAIPQILCFSLITGSHYRPWRALTYGTTRIGNYQYLPAMITGFLLRLVLLFGSFQSILVLVCIVEMKEELRALVVVWLIAMHFLVGLAIALTNPRFWIAATVATLINAPWVVILIVYFHEMGTFWFFMAGYLALWLGFMLCRCAALNPLFSSINKELRYYYLID